MTNYSDLYHIQDKIAAKLTENLSKIEAESTASTAKMDKEFSHLTSKIKAFSLSV